MEIIRISRQRRRRRTHQRLNAPRFLRWMIVVLASLLAVLVLALSTGLGTSVLIYKHYAALLPAPNEIIDAQQNAFLTTVLYDRTGDTVIYEVIDPSGGDRRWVSIDDIPHYFLDATVAIEDASFYKNPGFDLRGMTRALWNNLTGGHIQGASTITQQLVRYVLLDPKERASLSADRKIKEVILASEIARQYSKDQILEWYVNMIYYGGSAYGIEAAAQQYFSKPARDLTLAEAAMLAAIPQYPLQNPIDNPEAAKERQGVVLNVMANEGYITRQQANEAAAEPLSVRPLSDRFGIIAPHFAMYARAQAQEILDDLGLDGAELVTRGGLRIYTTLDLDLQLQAECVARSQIARLDGSDPLVTMNTSSGTPCIAANYLPQMPSDMLGVDREVSNAGVVVLRGATGEVMAMVGSVDYWNEGIDGTYNVATTAQRQPASAFKPIVYTAAFLEGPLPGYPSGITAATMLYDVPIQFDNGGQPYTPVNIDRQYHGPMSVRDALANSYNVPPVQLVNMIGLGPVVRTAHRLGINSLTRVEDFGLALALGSGTVSLLDLTYAYNVFNQSGYMVGMPVFKDQRAPGFRTVNPVGILRIEDDKGTVLWQYGDETASFQQRLILEPALAYIMTDILADNDAREPAFGIDSPLELSRPAAVKTGTSNDNHDSWTIGYTPQIVTGVWVGNNNNHSMNDITGTTGAAPIWHAIMEYVHNRDSMPVETWQRPSTVVEQVVCQTSGLLPTRYCRQTPELFYVDPTVPYDTRPTQIDPYWKPYEINTCSGLLATASSPSTCVEEVDYFDYPPETRAWARDTGQRMPPTEYDVNGSSSPFSAVAITSPSDLGRVRGLVEVRGNATDDNFSYYRLDYGAGIQPDVWLQIAQGTDQGRDLVMGTWDTSGLSSGAAYTLRLQMVRSDNTLETIYVSVTVDNTPPQVRLNDPPDGSIYSINQDVYVPLQAEVTDNVQVATVEFYHDGELIDTSEEWPYTAHWTISGEPGTYTLWAVAYDAAGNSAESDHITVQVQP